MVLVQDGTAAVATEVGWVGVGGLQERAWENGPNDVAQTKAEVENAQNGAAALFWPKFQGHHIHT